MRTMPVVLILLSSCTITFKSRVDPNTATLQNFSWSVDATTKGTIAHMHVQAVDLGKHINVAGYLAPTQKGQKLLEKQPVRFYRADSSYMTDNKEYNGVTLPLRLQWMAVERSKQIVNIYEQERRISLRENELLELAEACYRGFSKLHIANRSAYAFSNLDTQIEIKFAGKKFFDRDKIIPEINKKEKELRTKKISHKKQRGKCALEQSMLTLIGKAYSGVFELYDGIVPALPTVQELLFDNKARGDAEFVQLAHAFVQLKWARLLLARALLQLYKPHQLLFFYSVGVKEHLHVTAFPDDRKQKDSRFRYEMRTTSANHKKEFTLGHIIFDHAFKLKGMWISLKPRGNVPGFAKLTFKPCSMALQCPAADFSANALNSAGNTLSSPVHQSN